MGIIVIDAGHGGTSMVNGSSANNATGPTGLQEKQVTLDLALAVVAKFQGKGHVVKMTRDTDINLGLAARAQVAAALNADVFLSIHLNGNTDPAIQGTETWVETVCTSDSRLLAAVVQSRLVKATNLKDRKVRSKGLGVLKMSVQSPNTACCLAEISFLTNPTEEARLRTDVYKKSIASALAQALLDYLNHSTGNIPANPVPDGDPNGNGDA